MKDFDDIKMHSTTIKIIKKINKYLIKNKARNFSLRYLPLQNKT
jgi:hypothetical protein